MNTITRFFELQELGYVNIWNYTPFLFLAIIVGLSFGFMSLFIIAYETDSFTLGTFVLSGVALLVTGYMTISMMDLEVSTVDNNLTVLEEVNTRIDQDYTVIMNIGDGPVKMIGYNCTYDSVKNYGFKIDDTNKIITIHD